MTLIGSCCDDGAGADIRVQHTNPTVVDPLTSIYSLNLFAGSLLVSS